MTEQAIKPASEHFDVADAERRIKAILIGSIKTASAMHRHE